ncbi:MAG TPA: gamma-glutamyl-gamma-aminobutyrate hydrolase family protein [Cyclobacteriaceae bacterium]
MKKIIIGISDCSKYDAYAKWIEGEEGVETLRLSYTNNNFQDIEKCHGIVLSGGEDIHPRYYNKSEYVEQYNLDDIIDDRDALEWKILEYVRDKKLPLLGICRGLQVANVFFGGTLIPDIPSFGKFNHSKFPEYDRYHTIHVDPDSLLGKIVGNNHQGSVNSAHHQSAELIGKDLVANAVSADNVVEGIEWKNPKGKPFLMLVQWHPERMKDQESAYTKNIRSAFIESVRASN